MAASSSKRERQSEEQSATAKSLAAVLPHLQAHLAEATALLKVDSASDMARAVLDCICGAAKGLQELNADNECRDRVIRAARYRTLTPQQMAVVERLVAVTKNFHQSDSDYQHSGSRDVGFEEEVSAALTDPVTATTAVTLHLYAFHAPEREDGTTISFTRVDGKRKVSHVFYDSAGYVPEAVVAFRQVVASDESCGALASILEEADDTALRVFLSLILYVQCERTDEFCDGNRVPCGFDT
jgi:hypothetical protein